MATNTIDVEWKSGLSFEAHQQNQSYNLVSSGSEADMGLGISPKQMLLTALAGCTGMDVALMLPKMRVPFSSLRVTATGELTTEHPKMYSSIHVTYLVGTEEAYRPQIESAVEKSTSTYCGVQAMLSKASIITHDIVIVAE